MVREVAPPPPPGAEERNEVAAAQSGRILGTAQFWRNLAKCQPGRHWQPHDQHRLAKSGPDLGSRSNL